MDILYISPKAGNDLTKYCESSLLIEVLEHFAKNAIIIAKDNNSHPSRWWVITDYINDETIDLRKKISVILAFAAIGGFVQIGDRIEQGNVNTLNMFRDGQYVSGEDYDFFIETFYNFSRGEGVKFSL